MNDMLKLFTMAVIILAVCSAGAFASYSVGKYFDDRRNDIKDFDDCVMAGNSAVAGNPIRCIDEDGNVFFKEAP